MLFKTLITMKPSSKGISLLLILDTSSNLKKPAKDKTYIATLRNSTGLSRSDLLIISWIKVAEIGSLRLRSRSFMRVRVHICKIIPSIRRSLVVVVVFLVIDSILFSLINRISFSYLLI